MELRRWTLHRCAHPPFPGSLFLLRGSCLGTSAASAKMIRKENWRITTRSSTSGHTRRTGSMQRKGEHVLPGQLACPKWRYPIQKLDIGVVFEYVPYGTDVSHVYPLALGYTPLKHARWPLDSNIFETPLLLLRSHFCWY